MTISSLEVGLSHSPKTKSQPTNSQNSLSDLSQSTALESRSFESTPPTGTSAYSSQDTTQAPKHDIMNPRPVSAGEVLSLTEALSPRAQEPSTATKLPSTTDSRDMLLAGQKRTANGELKYPGRTPTSIHQLGASPMHSRSNSALSTESLQDVCVPLPSILSKKAQLTPKPALSNTTNASVLRSSQGPERLAIPHPRRSRIPRVPRLPPLLRLHSNTQPPPLPTIPSHRDRRPSPSPVQQHQLLIYITRLAQPPTAYPETRSSTR
ncbi:MAG: hypothetical protein Q9227_001059 [Pyrenula ochraceoflavens]